jgi:Rod binding domain-containing protein
VNINLITTPTGAANRVTPNDPKKIHEAACQFESLMIGEMLKTVKDAAGGDGLGGDEADSSGGLATDMGQEFFAQAIASKGGLGLAATIERGVTTEAARHRQAVSTTE